jgi:hypothetical protein
MFGFLSPIILMLLGDKAKQAIWDWIVNNIHHIRPVLQLWIAGCIITIVVKRIYNRFMYPILFSAKHPKVVFLICKLILRLMIMFAIIYTLCVYYNIV